MNNEPIKTVSSVKLLRNQLDNRLNFNSYISNIFRLAANQQDSFIGVKKYSNFSVKKVLINRLFQASTAACCYGCFQILNL